MSMFFMMVTTIIKQSNAVPYSYIGPI